MWFLSTPLDKKWYSRGERYFHKSAIMLVVIKLRDPKRITRKGRWGIHRPFHFLRR